MINPIKFFKILEYKINKYDKLFSNPFVYNKPKVTVLWIEEYDGERNDSY